ncbi:MAG: lamin tail domain-containing protein [bacterium]
MLRLFVFLFLCTCRFASAQVILTEVMYNPRVNDNTYEFIEIFNASTADTVSLFGWQIGDQVEIDSLISPDAFYRLAPQQYAVVLDPNYFLTTGIYDSLIPADALILTINDNTFGSGGLSNSTAETIVLVDAAGNTVARYTYSLGNADGISDEKTLLNADDAPSNWANSLRLDGTPGQRNSVTPYQIDGELLVGSFLISPASFREEQSARLTVTMRNTGLQTIAAATGEFWITATSANLLLPFRLGETALPNALNFGDTALVDFEWKRIIAGRHELAANLILPADEDRANDTLRTKIIVSHLRNAVRLNEIMYTPSAGQPEWIEIFNPRSAAISLADWSLEDESGTRALIPKNALLPPLSYLVLTASSSVAEAFNIADSLVLVLDRFPTLNNSGDVLLLRDFSGAVIDSVAYQADWGGSGISTEKVWYERENVAANWLPSEDPRGGTPAALNSVSPREIDLAAIRLSFDPPNPRAGEDILINAVVLNRSRRTVDRFAVTFANDRNQDGIVQDGEEIGTTMIEQAVAIEDSVVIGRLWPQPLSGRHRILAIVSTPLDAIPGNDRVSARLSVGYSRRSVVINEIYYAPNSGEAEWIEFYNRSGQPADLSEWRWRDAGAEFPVVFPDSALIIAPGEFAVLAVDRNIAHADSRTKLVIPKTWLTLNNDRDQLLLADFHGRGQDSLSYSQNWGGQTGVSLERINPHLAGADSSNWSGCVDPNGSTPGRPNSIFTEFVPSQATVAVSPQPFSPDNDGHDDAAIIQIQVPATTANVHLKIYDVRGRLVHQLLNNTPIGATHQVLWNGRDVANQPLPMGMYIVYLQAINAAGGILVEARTTLVLARKLN